MTFAPLLSLAPRNGLRSIVIAICVGLGFGIYMACADALLFRDVIPASQIAMVSGMTAVQRIATFGPLAVLEEIEFRLVVMSLLVWVLTTFAGRQAWCYWSAILITALLAYPAFHPAYLSTLAIAPATILREVALHGGAGVLWGYLYWRLGFAAAVIGHVSAHVSLEPLLSLFFT